MGNVKPTSTSLNIGSSSLFTGCNLWNPSSPIVSFGILGLIKIGVSIGGTTFVEGLIKIGVRIGISVDVEGLTKIGVSTGGTTFVGGIVGSTSLKIGSVTALIGSCTGGTTFVGGLTKIGISTGRKGGNSVATFVGRIVASTLLAIGLGSLRLSICCSGSISDGISKIGCWNSGFLMIVGISSITASLIGICSGGFWISIGGVIGRIEDSCERDGDPRLEYIIHIMTITARIAKNPKITPRTTDDIYLDEILFFMVKMGIVSSMFGTKYGSKYFSDEQLENARFLYPDCDKQGRDFGKWIDNLVDRYPEVEHHQGTVLIQDGGGNMILYLYRCLGRY